jgi:regulator of CtrA degradation
MTSIPANTAFFRRTYDETMGLLIEARNYVLVGELRHLRAMPPGDQLLLCCETMRLTARLTHVMAWLLAQRAVHAGEITLEDAASEPYALGGRTTCLTENAGIDRVGDDWLNALLDRSKRLYVRVCRLDDMVRREVGQKQAAP